MREHSKRWLVLVGLSIICCVLWFVIEGAQQKLVPAAEELLIDPADVPSSWVVKEVATWQIWGEDSNVLMDQGAVDWAWIIFVTPDDDQPSYRQAAVRQVVWNFGGTVWSWLEFRERMLPKESSYMSPVELPDWSYQSNVADQFQLLCGIVNPSELRQDEGGWLHCFAYGRYDRYLSEFSARIGEEYGMTLDDFRKIVEVIDERMAEQLHK
jgi:hypothetical protein